jgi:hypothetical protein
VDGGGSIDDEDIVEANADTTGRWEYFVRTLGEEALGEFLEATSQ